jgi:hypothetical protein
MGDSAILNLGGKLKLCEVVEIKEKSILYKISGTSHKIHRKNKGDIKYYKEYNDVVDLYCNNKYNTKYIVYCNYCNKDHLYNKLGYSSYRCNSLYSPYKKYGVNIIMKYNSLQECLLNNYKEYLRVYMNIYYYRFFIKFIDGETFGDYGLKHFPYYKKKDIKQHIKDNYAEENKKCSNGGLIASINKFIDMMSKGKLFLYNYKNTQEEQSIIDFYR